MSSHCGFVVEVKDLRPHSNADKLQLATFFGETVVVGLEVKIGDIGIYFPSDLQLSIEYCDSNDLCRTKADGTPGNGYLDRNKRNVTAIRLRGEKSYGLYMPISSLGFTGIDTSMLTVGTTVDIVNGILICQKYIPRANNTTKNISKNAKKKKKVNIAPLFAEHADTEQLAYNLDAFKPGDEIEITLKMHGTSQRTGYLPVLKGYRRSILDRILRREGTPIYDYGYVSGTRRTILEDYEGGYYGNNAFREQHSKIFEGKLWKGETVYYEVVGFTDAGVPIMASANNKKMNDKEFVKRYGETTVFSYGCSSTGKSEPIAYWDNDNTIPAIIPILPQSDIYVYRMTMTNPDGEVVEYTPDFMRYRCEQMGVKYVPVFTHFILHDYDLEMDTRSTGEIVKDVAERFYDGPDPIGKTHLREGVVVRIINRPKFCAYKHKNHTFKVLSGIAISEAENNNTISDLSDDILSEM